MPECDIGENNRQIAYDQPWLQNAIPYSNDKYESCVRYASVNKSESFIANEKDFQCFNNSFNTLERIECSEFIYASDEQNMQTEVNQLIK